MEAALAKACREESNFTVASVSALEAYRKSHPRFSVFAPAQVQELCRNLGLNYLIVSTFEFVSLSESRSEPGEARAQSAPAWRVTLRWLDGSTGQITKIHARECSGDIDMPESFPLRELFRALLESPDIIVPVEDSATEMPPPAIWISEVTAPMSDSSASDHAAMTTSLNQNQRGKRWLWYIAGAALVSGGSAVFFLGNSSKPAPPAKTLLPEPPDPPK
ncbi:MAG: hypothetical protein ONB45_01040 [candidate division KSB1 bacterium]|nr:hypothetical protein [candidate division KSB1 bacterium]